MQPIRRRNFLKSLGLPITLPFLPSLMGQAGHALAAEAPPRRLLLFFTGCGTVEDQFWPTGGERDFTFPAGSINEPLAPFRSRLIFPKGLRRMTSGSGAHEKNMGGLWTGCGLVATNGYPTGPSVDQIIASKLPAGPQFKSLQFGVQCDSFNRGGNKAVLKSMTYTARNAVAPPEDDPNAMFNKLMIQGAAAPTGPDPLEIDKLRAKKKSVLDVVRADLNALMTRSDRDDRSRLQHHLDTMAAIEKRLTMPVPTGGAGCTTPQKPMATLADPAARLLNENFPAILDVQNRLAVAALACNKTQVATVQWSRAFSPIRHTWVGVQEDHHTLSHKTGANDMKNQHAINRWYGQRMAELLGYMDAVKESNGSLLDNSLVSWGNEAATGNHDASRGVTVLAGRAGGKINTGDNGRFVNVTGFDWSQLLVTFCHAMGVTDVDKVGELPMKTGVIPALLS